MVACADTSFLFALYGNDAHSPLARAWVQSSPVAVSVSELAEYELANALRLAEFRKILAAGEAALYWARYEADRTAGFIALRVCNLAKIVAEAKRLSATYTLAAGHRGFDILHVAAAVEMGADQFLSFDENQKKLAAPEGLVTPL